MEYEQDLIPIIVKRAMPGFAKKTQLPSARSD